MLSKAAFKCGFFYLSRASTPSCRKTRIFMKQHRESAPYLAGYALGIEDFEDLKSEINRCIADGAVTDAVSPALKKIRGELSMLRSKTKEKRVKLLIPAEELYPDNFDLNIVLLSKEERKLKHRMERDLLHGVERIVPPEEQ